MWKWFVLCCAIGVFGGCGNDIDVTAPSVSLGVGPRTGIPTTSSEGRNIGTEVWLAPVPAGDLIQAIQHSELWPEAQKRVDVFAVYGAQAYPFHLEGVDCGKPCGPNTSTALMQAVEGGAFKWLSERFKLALEGGGVKEYSCTSETLRDATVWLMRSMEMIEKSGGRITYLAVDESFLSGVTTPHYSPAYRQTFGCGLSPERVANLLKEYVDLIHSHFPHIQVGFIESYPSSTADQLMSFLLELERAGVPIPFFQVDMHLQAVVRENHDLYRDLARLKQFCEARNIKFAVIIWGENGSSNQAFATDAWATLRIIKRAVGVTTQTKFQSWAENPPGDPLSLKNRPGLVTNDSGELVSETDPLTHTGQMLQQLEFLGVQPTQ